MSQNVILLWCCDLGGRNECIYGIICEVTAAVFSQDWIEAHGPWCISRMCFPLHSPLAFYKPANWQRKHFVQFLSIVNDDDVDSEKSNNSITLYFLTWLHWKHLESYVLLAFHGVLKRKLGYWCTEMHTSCVQCSTGCMPVSTHILWAGQGILILRSTFLFRCHIVIIYPETEMDHEVPTDSEFTNHALTGNRRWMISIYNYKTRTRIEWVNFQRARVSKPLDQSSSQPLCKVWSVLSWTDYEEIQFWKAHFWALHGLSSVNIPAEIFPGMYVARPPI